MISKNTIKHIHSLTIKKFRDAEGSFIAEGPKVVGDLLPLMDCKELFLTDQGFERFNAAKLLDGMAESSVHRITQAELERLSTLKAPREALGVFRTPQRQTDTKELAAIASKELCLALDGVQDPGNLGTIIRIADWFGIEHILASTTSADAFAPKVVQATMGAIGRVKMHYVDLESMLSKMDPDIPLYGTFLDGNNIYAKDLCPNGIVVMGNEGNGISAGVSALINRRLFVPNYPSERNTSESLNVAVATAIICAEFRRRSL